MVQDMKYLQMSMARRKIVQVTDSLAGLFFDKRIVVYRNTQCDSFAHLSSIFNEKRIYVSIAQSTFSRRLASYSPE
jgi:hypothetical protein